MTQLSLTAAVLALAAPAYSVQWITDGPVQTGAFFSTDNGPIEGMLQFTNSHGSPIWSLGQYL